MISRIWKHFCQTSSGLGTGQHTYLLIIQWLVNSITQTYHNLVGGAQRDITVLLPRYSGTDWSYVTVRGIWCVDEITMGDHHGQETGLRCDFDSSREKWTFGSGSLLCQRFSRTREETACKRKRIETNLVQPIPLGVTLSNALSTLKAQSSNVSFHWNVVKETFELWALSFRKCHPKWDWL